MATYDELKKLELPGLLEHLAKYSSGTTSGKDALTIIPSFVSVRTAEMVNKQLTATSETMAQSADRIKGTLENSSSFLIAALKVNTETASKNARDIEGQIATLTNAISQASKDVQAASAQSAKSANTLNRFTSILALGTLLLVGAACWQAYESHLQVNLISRQIQLMEQPPAPPPGKAQ